MYLFLYMHEDHGESHSWKVKAVRQHQAVSYTFWKHFVCPSHFILFLYLFTKLSYIKIMMYIAANHIAYLLFPHQFFPIHKATTIFCKSFRTLKIDLNIFFICPEFRKELDIYCSKGEFVFSSHRSDFFVHVLHL